jgi:hypothetical protein
LTKGAAMARILFAWELGAGLGHLAQIAPLAEELTLRGHTVFAALRDLSRAMLVFKPGTAFFLQAPHRVRYTPATAIESPRTFPHILYNNGFGEPAELATMTEAWTHLFRIAAPDAIVFDHSPSALLAARSVPVKKVLLGSGFCSPLDTYPMPDLWPSSSSNSGQLFAAEDRVLSSINDLLLFWKLGKLDRVSQLYAQVDANILTTYPELDHYPGRKNGTYYGDYSAISGRQPRWPPAKGKRIFAYLKRSAGLNRLLGWLSTSGHSVIVFGDAIPMEMVRPCATSTLVFETEPLDMKLIAKECDLAVLNGTHATTVALLKEGKPALHLPLVLEQWIMAKLITHLGAGIDAPADKPDFAIERLRALIDADPQMAGAKAFAAKYAGEQRESQVRRICDTLEVILS